MPSPHDPPLLGTEGASHFGCLGQRGGGSDASSSTADLSSAHDLAAGIHLDDCSMGSISSASSDCAARPCMRSEESKHGTTATHTWVPPGWYYVGNEGQARPYVGRQTAVRSTGRGTAAAAQRFQELLNREEQSASSASFDDLTANLQRDFLLFGAASLSSSGSSRADPLRLQDSPRMQSSPRSSPRMWRQTYRMPPDLDLLPRRAASERG